MRQRNRLCPECGTIMAAEATKCRCGYSAGREPSGPSASCSHRGCNAGATLSQHGANFCRAHYEAAIQNVAERYCDDQGLKTVAEMKAFCKTRKMGASDPRGWMRDIVERYEAGEYRWRANYIRACEGLGREPLPCPPV